MQYLSKSGRSFDTEILCLKDENEFLLKTVKQYKSAGIVGNALSYIFEETLKLKDIEKTAIIAALIKNQYNRRDAAYELDISERTIYRKLIDYNIDEKEIKKLTGIYKP